MRGRRTAALGLWLLLCGTATAAQAQGYGVMGGMNVSTIAVSPSGELGEISSKAGVLGGGFVTFKKESRLGLEVGGLLALRRIAFDSFITDSVTYLEAPVLARYSVMTGSTLVVRAVGGVVPAFRMAARERIGDESYSATDAYKPVDLAAAVGAQVEWHDKWTVGVRYLFGLIDVYEVAAGDEKTRQRGLQVLVGYRLK